MSLSAIRRFVERLNYRDKTLSHLNALLVYYPSGRQFTKDFPRLRQTIRAYHESGLTPQSAALQIATEIVGRFLQQLSDAQRAAVASSLAESDLATLERLAAKRMAQRRVKPGDAVTFATQLTGVALFMARRMAETGALGREEYRHLLTTIEQALGTKPEDSETMSLNPLAVVFGLGD